MMPTAIIHYQNPDALRILQQIGSSMGFTIDMPNTLETWPKETNVKIEFINGIPYQAANPKADITKIVGIFDGNNYTKQSLREKSWRKR